MEKRKKTMKNLMKNMPRLFPRKASCPVVKNYIQYMNYGLLDMIIIMEFPMEELEKNSILDSLPYQSQQGDQSLIVI